MRRVALLLLAALLLAGTACYRTRYLNFAPGSPTQPAPTADPLRVSGWQSFWLFGFVPGFIELEAHERCGTLENLHSIETRRKFVQGLIAVFAGYYVNIYSPWNAAIYCVRKP